VLSASVALLGLRLVLAGVLAWSGLAKVVDRAGFRTALAGFALPAGLAGAAAVVLPVAELVVAAALVPAGPAWWAAAAALVLLLAFTLVLAVTLLRGQRPECHCFGPFFARPISWLTVVRNGILVAAAAVLVAPGPGAPRLGLVAEAGRLSAAALAGLAVAVVLSGVAVTQGWVILQLLRQQGRMLIRLDALEAAQPGRGGAPQPIPSPQNGHAQGRPIGMPAPEFTLPALDGTPTSLRDLLAAGRPLVLAFVHPGCGPCTELLPELGRWRDDHASRVTLAVISTGTARENRKTAARYGSSLVLLQQDEEEISQAYAVTGTPALVTVGINGRISSHVAAGGPAIRALLADLAAGRSPHANGHRTLHQIGSPAGASRIGLPAPPVRLPDLSGNPADLADYLRHPTLLLFWNPACGFCQKMLGDLRGWEAGRTQGAPRLLVISTGTPEANQALGLASPVLLDAGFGVGAAFGASGTPSAILLDEHGRTASEVAVGAVAVFALAGHAATRQDMRPALTGEV
jgi:peroxiredoxin